MGCAIVTLDPKELHGQWHVNALYAQMWERVSHHVASPTAHACAQTVAPSYRIVFTDSSLGVLRHALVLTNTVANLRRGAQHRLTRKRFTCTVTCTEQLSIMVLQRTMIRCNSDDLEQLFLESNKALCTSILASDYKT